MESNPDCNDPKEGSMAKIEENGKPPSVYIYRQDVVKSKINGKIGVVTEVAGDSDSDSDTSSDEEEEEEDEEEEEEENEDADMANPNEDDNNENAPENPDNKELEADHVRVFWMDESESTQSQHDVTVIDRAFLHGDYVASLSDPTGQVGVVIDVNITVDLSTIDGTVINSVPSKILKRVRDFQVGDYVIFGPWLGRIDDVLDNVTVMFDDGSICKVMKADPSRLKPVGKNLLEDAHYPYYPGQRVKATSSSVFKNQRWISGLWKASRLEGTVTNVKAGSVFVYWIASAGYGPESSITPSEEQNPNKLNLLSCFSHANWELGDWCLLPSSTDNSGITNSSPKLEKTESDSEVGVQENTGITNSNPSRFEKTETDSKVGIQENTGITNSNPKLEKTETDSEVGVQENTGITNSSHSKLEKTETDSKVGIQENTGITNSNPKLEKTETDSEVGVQENTGITNSNPSTESSSCSSSSMTVSKGHESWGLHRKKMKKLVVRKEKKGRKKDENYEKALQIVNTKTLVDVLWQDGITKHGLDSISLIPIENPGDHEFVSEQYVVEKPSDSHDDEDDDNDKICKVGVVKSVNAKERTACVKWFKAVERAEDFKEFEKEEVVSVYELEGHQDYDYCYGDVVVRLPSADVAGLTEVKGEFSDLSWVGNITGLRNGDIEVTWADGMVSMVGPQAIYVVGRDDDDESAGGGSEVSDDAASWETMEDQNNDNNNNNNDMENIQKALEDLRMRNDSDMSLETEDQTSESIQTNGALSIPLAALGFMTRLASGIFSRGQRNVTDNNSGGNNNSSREEDKDSLLWDKNESTTSDDVSSSQKSSCTDTLERLASGSEHEHEHGDVEESLLSDLPGQQLNVESEVESSSRFRGFDIVKDPLDHYYLGVNGQNTTGRRWLKKVQQDWNILQNNLPNGIYVRCYENRMDLLRAVVVGAYGTPYQDGLFFFDFHLPPEYPDVPPSAYYHSGGWRINPNLYEEGKVCLSLLNTWTGKGNEVWDPQSSSILQVLVSLQGLVLNSKPYFNEAGYDKQVGTAEGEKNSVSYNENTFLLNCKTIMYLIRRPPKDFEDLVKEHFKERGYYILKACDAYMKGFLIGSLSEDASVCDTSIPDANSVGFKLMLAKIVPKLLIALNQVGANCQEFNHFKQDL